MDAILNFTYDIIHIVLTLVVVVVIAYAVVSWLTTFNVINLRNRFVYSATRFLDAVARPILRPIQRFLPTPGGLDFSPLVIIIVVPLVEADLIKPLFAWLHSLVGAPAAV